MFDVYADFDQRLLHISVGRGIPEPSFAREFQRDVLYHAGLLSRSGRSFDVMADLRVASVLPQDGAALIGETIAGLRERGMRRAAHLFGNMLTKLQIQRLASGAELAFFDTEEAALAWLSEGRETPLRAPASPPRRSASRAAPSAAAADP